MNVVNVMNVMNIINVMNVMNAMTEPTQVAAEVPTVNEEEVVVHTRDVLSDNDDVEVIDGAPNMGGVASQKEDDHVAAQAKIDKGKNVVDEVFPPLPKKNAAVGTRQGASTIAWKSTSPKVFMNAGLGGRLEYTKPVGESVKIKCVEAIPVHKVWGSSLLG